jgi:alkaline phosphatase D
MSVGRRGFLGSTLAAALLRPLRGFAAAPGYPRLMEGPMIGATGVDSITFWGRASGEFDVEVEYSTDRFLGATQKSAPVRARAADDFTVRIAVGGLAPATRYYYRLLVDGIPDRYRLTPFVARTAPAGAAPFRLAFGSCARHQLDAEQPIFRAISAAEPDVFVWLGDNIYADSVSEWVFAEDYRRQRAIASTLPLMRGVPQLAIWDDHDFGLNNSDRTNPVREAALAAFRKYWANPAYGQADDPGVYFQYDWGGSTSSCSTADTTARQTGMPTARTRRCSAVARASGCASRCTRAARHSRCWPAAAAGHARTGRPATPGPPS